MFAFAIFETLYSTALALTSFVEFWITQFFLPIQRVRIARGVVDRNVFIGQEDLQIFFLVETIVQALYRLPFRKKLSGVQSLANPCEEGLEQRLDCDLALLEAALAAMAFSASSAW